MRSARNILSNDWYGTSLLFAKTFRSSNIDCGSLREMVLVDGFRLGNFTLSAFSQPIYSVESWLAQKSHS